MAACGGERDKRPAQLVVRWIEDDITVSTVTPDGSLENWRVIKKTNSNRELMRYGVSTDGRHVCAVSRTGTLSVHPAMGTSTVSFTPEHALSDFDVDGCLTDREVNVLTFWRARSRVRTFTLADRALRTGSESTFENGLLGGPATVRSSALLEVAVVGSPSGMIETWASTGTGWVRREAHVEKEELLATPGVGSRVVVLAMTKRPAVVVLTLDADGAVTGREEVTTPQIVGRVTVAPDDRFAWMWGAAGYVLDLETSEIEEDRQLTECSMLSPRAFKTTSGYGIVGVRSENGRRDVGRCLLGDDGRVESIEPNETPPVRYASDRALSLDVVHLR